MTETYVGRHLAFTFLTTTNLSTATASFRTGWCGVVWCGEMWCGVAVSTFRYSAFLVRNKLKEIQRKECFPICGPWQRQCSQFEYIMSND